MSNQSTDIAEGSYSDERQIDIQTSGLLWLINKSLMHPRGYALCYDTETKGFSVVGNGRDCWHFKTTDEDPKNGINEDAYLAQIKELLP